MDVFFIFCFFIFVVVICLGELQKLRRKIAGILKFSFKQADLDSKGIITSVEFGNLLKQLGVNVSIKGIELLYHEILSLHKKKNQNMSFYEFKQAFMVNDPSIYRKK